MAYTHKMVNGEQVPLTPEEIAELEARDAAWAAGAAARNAIANNEASLRNKADLAIATLEQMDTDWATLTQAQKIGATQIVARILAKTLRLMQRKFDSD